MGIVNWLRSTGDVVTPASNPRAGELCVNHGSHNTPTASMRTVHGKSAAIQISKRGGAYISSKELAELPEVQKMQQQAWLIVKRTRNR